MQHFDISIEANAVRQINVLANFIYFLEGSAGGADNTIALRKRSGSETVLLKPGQSITLPIEEAGDHWIVSNYANASTIVGKLLFGVGKFDDNRISGSVEVIDGGKARTLAGLAYMSNISLAANPAQYPVLQIWNPANTGKNIVVEQLTMSSSVADVLILMDSTAAISGVAYTASQNKKLGGAAGASINYTLSTAVFPVDPRLGSYQVGANSLCEVSLREPIVIVPGHGLKIASATAAAVLYCATEFYEESAT